MKTLVAALPLSLLIALTPVLSSAQTTKAIKPASKAAAANAAAARNLKAARVKAAEEATPVDDDPAVKLNDADLEVARKVYLGDIPCELGATVHITPHKREGFFIVRAGIQRFRMHPVESKTGAIRLEDPVAGAMWLQLGNKSMLMSQKMGKRLADDCMNPAQSAMNETLKKNPINILEAAPVVKVAAPAGDAAARASTPPTAEAQEPPPKAAAAAEAPAAAAAPAPETPAAAPATK